MKSVRSLLLCAAIAGALAAPAADPVAVVRLRSVNAALAVARDASALAGQPFAAVMAESMLRSQIAQTGVELREDDPILLAVLPNPAPEDGSGELGMVGLLEAPPAMVFAVPAAPFPADLLEKMLDSTNAPAPGEWLANEDGDLFYAYRDGYALVAATADGRALAERLLAAKPARPDALLEFSIDEPAEFQRRMELGDAKEEAVAAACDAIAETLGLPGFGDKVKLVLDAAEKTDRETERYDVDVWFDPTNGLAFAVSRVAKEGSDLAARIAAAPALDPAALPGVPAGAPFWTVQAACESPEADLKAMLGAIRGLVEGPAPSGDAAATAQRASALRMLDANLAALPAFGAVAAYATADAEGRPVFAMETRIRDAASARTLRDAQAALLESFPCLASNGVAVVREENGDVRVDVAIADAFVGVARLAHELERLEEEDDGSDLWVDDEEDGTEEDGEDGEKADEEEEDEVSNEPEDDEDAAGDAGEEFDEAEAREAAKAVAELVGEKLEFRDAIAADGSSERGTVSAPGAKVPEAKGVPGLADSLALQGAFLSGGARPFGAGAFSARSILAAYLPAILRIDAASDDPMDEDTKGKLKAFAEGEADFRIRVLSAAEGRTLSAAFAIPRADIEALAKLIVEAGQSEGGDALFDEDEDVDLDDDADADDDADDAA